jgi:hypothetical protein
MSRVLGRPAQAFACVDDYEAVSAPVFAWRDAVARDGRTGAALNGLLTVDVWRALGGSVGGGSAGAPARGLSPRARVSSALRALRMRAIVAAFPLAVAAINRAGIGPVGSDVSAGELRRAGLNAMAEVAARLGLGDAHVIFGHTHRAGALPGDRGAEWRAGRLTNAGCWTYSPNFLTSTPGESPYWPGACVLVEDSGPPLLKRLLQDRTHAELGRGFRPPRG